MIYAEIDERVRLGSFLWLNTCNGRVRQMLLWRMSFLAKNKKQNSDEFSIEIAIE